MKFLVKSIFVLFAFSTFVHAEVRKERQVALIGVEPRAGGVSVVGTFLVEGVKAAASSALATTIYEGVTQAASYVYNWFTGSSLPLGRSGDEFSVDFEAIYNETIVSVFGDAWNSFDSELQGFVDEKVGGARAASEEFDRVLRACKNHKCAKHFIKENKKILDEYVDEVICSQNKTLKEMTDEALQNLITNIKQSSLKIILDIGDVAAGCFVCEGKRGGAPNPCLIDGVPVIPAANPDSIKADADIGKGGAVDAMRVAVEKGKIVISDETDNFHVKLEHLKEEFKKCSSRPRSSSEEY